MKRVNNKLIIDNISIIDGVRMGTMRKWLYYIDIYYVSTEDFGTYGDLGYEHCDKIETRNTNCLTKNIVNLRECAIDEAKEWLELENEVKVWEVHKALFEDTFRVSEDELGSDTLEDYLNNEIWSNCLCNMCEDVEDEVIYTIVVADTDNVSNEVREVIQSFSHYGINEIINTTRINEEE